MYLFNAACSLAGLLVICLIVGAVVLAAGGNLHCGVDHQGSIVAVVCQSPILGH